MKRCPKCKTIKEIERFSKNKARCDRLSCWCRECNRLYKQDSKSRIREYNKIYQKKKYDLDLNFRLSFILRTSLARGLKRGKSAALEYLGLPLSEFIAYIESRFQSGMSWDNYGKWHLDHIIPLSKFNLDRKEEIVKACNWSNFQPLWAIENFKKNNRV